MKSCIGGILALIVVLPTQGVAAGQADGPPRGRTRELAVAVAEVAPHIDGSIEQVWGETRVATDFWISEYGQAPAERTEVRVLADGRALYFAVTCYDSRPQEIRADQNRRDASMGLDDVFVVELDPHHNHRLISRFSVNARGAQTDAMAGGRGHTVAWKGDWQTAVTRTAYGWTAEIAIPFDILEFDPSATVFGVNFVRYHSRTREWSRWADVTPQDLPEEAGHIVGLQLREIPRARRVLAMPYAFGGVDVSPGPGKDLAASAAAGLDLRVEPARNVTGVLTVNPDFSHVESTIADLAFDYNEKFLRDPRPFFQDGAAFFGNATYFHSGRIPDFLMGAKAFGKRGRYQTGMLATVTTADDGGGRTDYVGLLKRDIGQTVTAGGTFVATDRTELSNQLAGANVNGRIGRHLSFGLDVAATRTTGLAGNGTLAALSLGYTSSYLEFGAKVDRIDQGFFPANGFMRDDLLGTRGGTVYASVGRGFWSHPFRRVDANISFGERDTRERLVRVQRQDLSIYASAELRSNVQLSGGLTRGPYRPRSGTDGWRDYTHDDRFYTASGSYDSPSGRYGYGLTYSWGFLAGADYGDVVPFGWLKPSRQTSVSYSFERAESFGVSQQHVLSATWDVTSEQGISGRWVQYQEAFYRLAYRRIVRKGIDVFAVYDRGSDQADRFTTKVVWTTDLMALRNAGAQ